jgi:cytoskeletal protein CcmA (bactofilin family)
MKAITKGSIRDEKGAALVLALILLLVGGLISAALLGHMGTGILAGEAYDTKTAELYAADAGVEDAILKIQNQVDEVKILSCSASNHSWTYPEPGDAPFEVNDKDVEVTVAWVGNGTYNITYSITSVATTPDTNSQTTIESYVKYTPAVPPVEPVFLFGDAIRSDTTLYSERATWVTSYPTPLNGDIVTGGKFTVSGTIYGDVTVPTVGDLTTTKGILGNIIYAPYSPPATPDISPYKTQAVAAENATIDTASKYNNGGTITSSARLSGNLALASGKTLTVNGDLYIEGYITMAGTSTLTVKGALYVGSYITANADSKLNFGGTSYINGAMTLGRNNISEVSYVLIAKNNIFFGDEDNGNNALIEGIYGKYDGKGGLKGLTAAEDAYLKGPHSIIMSETGNIATKAADNVEIGGFLYARAPAPAGIITTHHFFRLIGAMSGNSVIIDDLRQIYAGIPAGSSGSGSDGSPASLTILTWDIH